MRNNQLGLRIEYQVSSEKTAMPTNVNNQQYKAWKNQACT
jgi:hypothetical protein